MTDSDQVKAHNIMVCEAAFQQHLNAWGQTPECNGPEDCVVAQDPAALLHGVFCPTVVHKQLLSFRVDENTWKLHDCDKVKKKPKPGTCLNVLTPACERQDDTARCVNRRPDGVPAEWKRHTVHDIIDIVVPPTFVKREVQGSEGMGYVFDGPECTFEVGVSPYAMDYVWNEKTARRTQRAISGRTVEVTSDQSWPWYLHLPDRLFRTGTNLPNVWLPTGGVRYNLALLLFCSSAKSRDALAAVLDGVIVP